MNDASGATSHTDATRPSAEVTALEAARRRMEQRVDAIESILISIPMIVIEVLLVLSLLVPFVTSEVDEEAQTVNLLGLLGGLFSSGDDGEIDEGAILFGVAFVVLVVVIVGSIFTVPLLARRRVTPRAGATAITFIVLLILGSIGAWTVMAMGLNSEDSPWIMEPALPLLTAATVLAAMIAFLPAYRSIWEH
ncbi:MAG TPA: hypothetical protein VNJ54_05955 [Plantibacter sp.]|uniref:hypothetical protein n=1 Tax=unclassified Plantibacter TaxID=2624265 RepID=UPI002D032131|nr:hypothetical protein [Plantibacter sp.]